MAFSWMAGAAVWAASAGAGVDSRGGDGPLQAIRKALPLSVSTWKVDGEDRFFEGNGIFSYIDGGGELYLAYHMRTLMARTYVDGKNRELIVDVFLMPAPNEAFGVFTHDLSGEGAGVGAGSRYRPGWLSFWKGPVFASITAQSDDEEARRSIMLLAEAISGAIPGPSPLPEVVASLPKAGLKEAETRYFHDHRLLNTHYFLADANILKLSGQTEAILADYSREDVPAKLLLVSYPSAGEAQSALSSFRKAYLKSDEGSTVARTDGGKWSGCEAGGRLLSVVLEAGTRGLAEALLVESIRSGGRLPPACGDAVGRRKSGL